MEFKIKKRNRKSKDYSQEDLLLAKKFSKELLKEFNNFIKAIVLFGSAAKETAKKKSDIDILIIVDDVETIINEELTQTYRLIVEKLAAKISFKFHINTLKVSNFWKKTIEGDPVLINILRDGIVIFDTGFFKPVQYLLDTGRIKPSKEAIWIYYLRAPVSLDNAERNILQACIDLYWAGIDASHAALMSLEMVPPSPEHVPEMLMELVNKGLLREKYPLIMKELYDLSKHITHREIKRISGKQFDYYFQETKELVESLKKIVKKQEEKLKK